MKDSSRMSVHIQIRRHCLRRETDRFHFVFLHLIADVVMGILAVFLRIAAEALIFIFNCFVNSSIIATPLLSISQSFYTHCIEFKMYFIVYKICTVLARQKQITFYVYGINKRGYCTRIRKKVTEFAVVRFSIDGQIPAATTFSWHFRFQKCLPVNRNQKRGSKMKIGLPHARFIKRKPYKHTEIRF